MRFTLISLFLLLACQFTDVGAQARRELGTRRDTVGLKPSTGFDAKLAIRTFNRILPIHRADGTDPGTSHLYFHRPLLSFLERTNALENYPSIVWKATRVDAQRTRLDFQIQITTSTLQKLCADAV